MEFEKFKIFIERSVEKRYDWMSSRKNFSKQVLNDARLKVKRE